LLLHRETSPIIIPAKPEEELTLPKYPNYMIKPLSKKAKQSPL